MSLKRVYVCDSCGEEVDAKPSPNVVGIMSDNLPFGWTTVQLSTGLPSRIDGEGVWFNVCTVCIVELRLFLHIPAPKVEVRS